MMATTSFAPANQTNLYFNPETGPSPPESYAFGKNTPPSNVSPTSVSSGHSNARQLRQPRQPLYTPAALRPTDRFGRPTDIPSRPRPLDTPPTSKDSSLDSGIAISPDSTDVLASPVDSHGDLSDMEAIRRGLSRSESETLEDEPGEVTGLPTTAHWRPDTSASACYICQAQFTWFFRKHHCRRCGQIVCDAHLRHAVPLDQNARYHPQGTASKACKACWDHCKLVMKYQHSRASSIAESSSSSQGTAMPIPNAAKPNNDVRVGSMARSEGGHAWSTF